MTGAEREDFRQLRAEMRDGFQETHTLIHEVGLRVSSLELSRAEQMGASSERRTAEERISSERRWRIGVLFGIAGAVATGLLNLLYGSGTIPAT